MGRSRSADQLNGSSARRPRGRVLVAKVGLDGHEAGAKWIALMLRDAGYEVIYSGPRTSPAMVAQMAIDEDVDLVGVSLLSGAHVHAAQEISAHFRAAGCDTPLLFGGIIPPGDREVLRAHGVAAVFGPGATSTEILACVGRLIEAR